MYLFLSLFICCISLFRIYIIYRSSLSGSTFRMLPRVWLGSVNSACSRHGPSKSDEWTHSTKRMMKKSVPWDLRNVEA